jgi:hypothetical protein
VILPPLVFPASTFALPARSVETRTAAKTSTSWRLRRQHRQCKRLLSSEKNLSFSVTFLLKDSSNVISVFPHSPSLQMAYFCTAQVLLLLSNSVPLLSRRCDSRPNVDWPNDNGPIRRVFLGVSLVC